MHAPGHAACGMTYHPSRDPGSDRPDPRRGPGHAHALAHAEGAARAVRAPDGALAGRGRARGRAPAAWSSSTRPRERSREVLPEGVELAVQPQPNGTGGAVAAAMAALAERRRRGVDAARRWSSSAATCRSSAPRRSRELLAPTEQRREPPRWRRPSSTTPAATGAWCATRTARSSAWSRPRPRRRDAAEREIREVNTGIYVFAVRRAARGAAAAERGQRAGRAVPAPGARLRCADGGPRWRRTSVDGPALVLGVNDRAELAQVRALAQQAIHARHMRAGVTIVDPRATVIDVDVEIGAGHHDRAVHARIRGARPHRRGLHDHAHSYLIDSVLEDGVVVGPFAYLRPGHGAARGRRRWGRSSRSRTPTSARARRCPTSPTSATPTSASGTNLGAARSPRTTTARDKHRTTIGARVRTRRDTTLRGAGARSATTPTRAPAR